MLREINIMWSEQDVSYDLPQIVSNSISCDILPAEDRVTDLVVGLLRKISREIYVARD
jgi:hypothetical protein